MTLPLALSQTTINVAYLVAAVGLIVGIKRLSSPATARSGNVVAAVGMALALVVTLLDSDIDTYWLIAAGVAVFTGQVWARTVGVLLATLSAVVNIGFLAAYPIWSTILITIDILVIWALTVHGGELREDY